MGNIIKRNSVFMTIKFLVDAHPFKVNDIVGIYKDENNNWIGLDKQGKNWRFAPSLLRNENYFKLLSQYPMHDIIYYLMDKDPDYQTVLWGLLVDAVKTTFAECNVSNLKDIYMYIHTNLI